MGNIWIQQSSGRMIHLPIVGPDYNTPDSPQKIPASAVGTALADRCLSGLVQITIPGQGNVTFTFDPPGRTGSCNQCGSCCVHPVGSCPSPTGQCGYILNTKYQVHACQYLEIRPGNNKLHNADGTSCTLRASLADGFKGCLMTPEKPSEMWPWMNNCGFTFSA